MVQKSSRIGKIFTKHCRHGGVELHVLGNYEGRVVIVAWLVVWVRINVSGLDRIRRRVLEWWHVAKEELHSRKRHRRSLDRVRWLHGRMSAHGWVPSGSTNGDRLKRFVF